MSTTEHAEHHGPDYGTYWTIFGCLAALTVATVVVSWIHMPRSAAVVVAFMIAISKATLVVSFFMHLKYDAKVLRLVCVVPTILTLGLLLALLPDVGMVAPGVAGAPAPKFETAMIDDEFADEDLHADEGGH